MTVFIATHPSHRVCTKYAAFSRAQSDPAPIHGSENAAAACTCGGRVS